MTALFIAYWGMTLAFSLHLLPWLNLQTLPWFSALAINFSFQLDALSQLFSTVICFIGIIIFVYAHCYSVTEERIKLLSLLQLFAISMLLLVLTDNLIILFLAWELTTVFSFLLIQFKKTDSSANQAAFMSMSISVLGALCLLVMCILLLLCFATWNISTILHQLTNSTTTALYSHYQSAIFVLLVMAIITKSCQFPFHFWLPSAMKAPTPVSAYLHSATMVNAGIYLLARFHPGLSHLHYWYTALMIIGQITMLLSALISLFKNDLKAIFAYTTIYALGLMVYMLASDSALSVKIFILFFIFHAFYKAAGFMLIGIIDKEYQSRDIYTIAGIARKRHSIAILSIIILVAMAGLPPFTGFMIKVMVFEAKINGGKSWPAFVSSMISSLFIMTTSMRCLYYLFAKECKARHHKTLHFAILCPWILAAGLVLFVIFNHQLAEFAKTTALSIHADTQITASHISILSLGLNIIIIMLSFIFLMLMVKKQWHMRLKNNISGAGLFDAFIQKTILLCTVITNNTQERSLTFHLRIALLFFIAIIGLSMPTMWHNNLAPFIHIDNIHNAVILGLLIVFIAMVLFSKKITSSFIYLSIFGVLLSLYFILNGAIDLAMTQLLIEILGIIILLLTCSKIKVVYHLSISNVNKLTNVIISLLLGLSLGAAIQQVIKHPMSFSISDYFIKHSLANAYGKNVVNVILVDFRALDTLGEVCVVIAVALAIRVLYNQHNKRKRTWKNL